MLPKVNRYVKRIISRNSEIHRNSSVKFCGFVLPAGSKLIRLIIDAEYTQVIKWTRAYIYILRCLVIRIHNHNKLGFSDVVWIDNKDKFLFNREA